MLDFELNDPNILNSDEDYVMHPNAQSIWITVDGVSVNLVRTDEGVVVDLYPLRDETADLVASTYTFHAELRYTNMALDELWEEFEGIGISDCYQIEERFLHFPEGTSEQAIEEWFRDQRATNEDS